LWGLFSGGALVLRVAVGYCAALPTRTVATVMAFGSGVLVSALSSERMEPAYSSGGLSSALPGKP